MGYAGEVEWQPVNDLWLASPRVSDLSTLRRHLSWSRAFDAEDSGYLGIVDFLPTKHTVVFSR